MLACVLFFFLPFVPVCRAECYDADGDIDRADAYDRYNEEITAPRKITTVMEALTRLKRWDIDDLGTLSQEEPNVDMKGVLNNILQGDQPDALREPRNPQEQADSYVYVENAVLDSAKYLPNREWEFQQWMPTVEVSKSASDEKQENTIESSSEGVTEQHWSFMYQPETSTNDNNDIIAETRKLQPIKEGEVLKQFLIESWGTKEGTEATVDADNYPQEPTTYNPSEMEAEVKKLVQHWTPATRADNYPQESTIYNSSEMKAEVKKLVQHWTPATNADAFNSSDDSEAYPRKNIMREGEDTTSSNETTSPSASSESTSPSEFSKSTSSSASSESTSSSASPETNTNTTRKITKQPIDIDEIMAIIFNLTYDYEWNLTEAFNKSLIEHGVPTCPRRGGEKWTATPTESTTFFNFDNTSTIGKCFVCGLTDVEIPRNAYCSDAFAGDFLPVMPFDVGSRGKIAGYRKTCRHADVQNYIENPENTGAIYGRFTGGCAVRWTDVTGVYTQRTCRVKTRPLLGKHFASKRMAKLELALANVENGCIISPMATLLPVSRGISLYARFHACVCTGDWCNRAILIKVSTNSVVAFVLYWFLNTCTS